MGNIFDPDDQPDFDPLKMSSTEYERLLNDLLSHHGPNSIPHMHNSPDEDFFKAWGARTNDVDDIEDNKVHRLYEIRLAGITNIRIAHLFSRTNVQTLRFRIWTFMSTIME